MKVWVGPTGRLSTGNVLDVGVKAFEQALRDHDHLLYIRWNPRKLKGWGCWEVRRRPEKKSVTHVFEWEGNTYCYINNEEIDIVNHVLDAGYLNYDLLTRIKAMDTWAGNRNYWVEDLENKEKAHVAAKQAKAREDMRYAAKQMKSEIKDLKEMLKSGLNPAQIADHWK